MKLHIGDKIVAVAEGHGPFVNIVHSNLDKITEMVLGKSGSMVRLQIISSRNKNGSKRQVISLVREEIRLTEEEAQAELIEVHSHGVAQKPVISDLKLPSLSEATAPTESEQEHRLAYDSVPTAAADLLRGQPLFLDELRSRSEVRIKEDPLFQDLTSAIALTNESTEKNRVSLNEKVRRDELTDRARRQNKADSDRKAARAQGHNKYYQLTLADVDKPKLRLANYGSEQDTFVHNPPDKGLQLIPNPLSEGNW